MRAREGGGRPGVSGPSPPASGSVLLLYNAVFLVGFLLHFLFGTWWKLLRSGSYRKGFLERMGYVQGRGKDPVIWIHGVSVGEVKAAQPIVRSLRSVLPGLSILISSTTPTGKAEARRLYPDLPVIYYPLDFGSFPRRALSRIRPVCVLLVELELWPNFLWAAERRGCPVAVINGRISRRSFRGYSLVARLLPPLPQLDRIDLFCVQDATYADRLRSLGVPEDRITLTGNLKYDAIRMQEGEARRDPELCGLLGLEEEEPVVVAGSTHAGEEGRIARTVLELEKSLGRKIRLIVAPRHANERGGSVLDEIRRAFRQAQADGRHGVQLWTELRSGGPRQEGRPWIVVDTIGELERFYKMATICFVGGSLVPRGGQNMLEPVALGKPTLFGPHVANFQNDVDLLLAGKGALQVGCDRELGEKLRFLLSHPGEARALVLRAQKVLRENQGATAATTERVVGLLRGRVPDLFDEAGGSAEQDEHQDQEGSQQGQGHRGPFPGSVG